MRGYIMINLNKTNVKANQSFDYL